MADFDTRTVKVTPLGINPSGVNGFCLKQNVEYTLKHSDRLELLLEQYIHEIVFDPAPSEDENKITLKRKIEDSAEEKNLKQPKRAETQKTKSWEEVDDKNLYVFTSEGVQPKEKVRIVIFINFFF